MGILLVVWPALLAMPLRVAAACDPNRPQTAEYNWVSASTALVGARGVYAQIKTYSPYVEASGFSYSWVMLPGPAANEWAQIGPNKTAGNWVTQYQLQQPGHPLIWGDLPAYPIGSVHSYSVGTDPVTNQFHVYVDGVDKAWATLYWTPSGASIAAETWLLSSQLMGESSSHETFRNGQYMNASGTWQSMSGSVTSTDTNHFSYSGNAVNFDSWDRCNR